jgi:hypothetical protein
MSESPLRPANFNTARGNPYWGDYFDMTQVQDPGGGWSSVAVFSDSRPAPTPPCSVNSFGTETGHPQHVVSVRW